MIEVTIKDNGCWTTTEVSDEVYKCLKAGKNKAENLRHERRHWDVRGFDEYIAAIEGRLGYQATPEELVCQKETRDELLAILQTCTNIQRERFLLYALDGFTYAEIGEMCGCSKYAVRDSVEAVRKIFKKILPVRLDCRTCWREGSITKYRILCYNQSMRRIGDAENESEVYGRNRR